MRQHNRPGRCTDPSAGVATNQPVVANPRRRGEPAPSWRTRAVVANPHH
jgi:hypothetical protein